MTRRWGMFRKHLPPRHSQSNQGLSVPPHLTVSRLRASWSTLPGACPGVYRRRRRWQARVCIAGRWVSLGLHPSEWLAARLSAQAKLAPAAVKLKLAAAATVRERLRLLERLAGYRP